MIFVLSRSGFHRDETTSVNVREITVREFISALRIRGVTIVHAEMPLRVFGEAVHGNEVIFRSRRRFVLMPHPSPIQDQMSFPDELRRKCDTIFIQLDVGIRLCAGITDRVETNDQPNERYTVASFTACSHS